MYSSKYKLIKINGLIENIVNILKNIINKNGGDFMKKWDKPTVLELGLEKTEENTCPIESEGSSTYTAYPDYENGCPKGRYEPTIVFGICKHFNCNAPGRCNLNVSTTS